MDFLFWIFLSTPSSQRATCFFQQMIYLRRKFLSTPSSQRATLLKNVEVKAYIAISIHALFAEGDRPLQAWIYYVEKFLSTPSSQRATHPQQYDRDQGRHFYPRPLRRGRPTGASLAATEKHFYPRPLRRGRPSSSSNRPSNSTDFYPRPLRRGRQNPTYLTGGSFYISIHALFAEGDGVGLYYAFKDGIFLSTPSSQRATATGQRPR